MRQLIALSAVVLGLAVTGAASAGGWATVAVDPLPEGIDAGGTWRTEVTVLQHGRTPLAGLSPTITIRETGTGLEREFAAVETAKTGVYAADVLFPERGQWNVRVETGWWGQGELTFGPVAVGDAPAGGVTSDDFPVVPLAVLVLTLALLAAAALGARRRWRPMPSR